MEIANITLAIGGDKGHTVPKLGVTPSEIAVLRSIHGEEAVFDVAVVGDITRTGREDIARLKLAYGKAEDGMGGRIVDGLFPGAAARAFSEVSELELPSVLLKDGGRTFAKSASAAEAPAEAPAESKPKAKPRGKKTAPTPVVPEAPQSPDENSADDADDGNDADGISDITD